MQSPFNTPLPYQHLINRIPQCLVVLDTQQRIVFMNQAMEALTGFSQEEAAQLPCRFVIRSSLCGLRCPIKQMDAQTEPFSLEGDIINKQRQKVPVRLTCLPLLDIHGELAGWLECFDDLRLVQEVASKKAKAFGLGPLIGHSREMENVFTLTKGISGTDSSVLITGETGTGKDVLAEVIHQESSRAQGPFVKVNCGALPETLLESELFGHQRGAFTGATDTKPGRFKLAHNGTLFLTEIGDLPLILQVKLLSFLDDQVIYPLGSTKGVQVNVRVIAATNRDLKVMVREGRFREDLYYRLHVVRVHLPPLRDRGADVGSLLEHFLHSYLHKFQKKIQGFSAESQQILMAYAYPGNVRELKNIVEFAVNICDGAEIEVRHLPGYLKDALAEGSLEEFQVGPGPGATEGGRAPRQETWSETEKEMIRSALVRNRGKKQKAAEALGWARSTLWRKMKQYGLSN